MKNSKNSKDMKILNYLLAAVLLLAFAACSDDDEPVVVSPEEENLVAQFDPQFVSKLFLKGYIDDLHRITRADVEGITKLDVSGDYDDYEEGKGMVSLKGIEYFTALDTLYCSYNRLAALDVSRNTALEYMDCSNNRLASLDVSGNTALEYMDCGTNRLTALDVSRNTALKYLDCAVNRLPSLDVSRNTALKYLHYDINPGEHGTFTLFVWPGSELIEEWFYGWIYGGEAVNVNYVEKEE